MLIYWNASPEIFSIGSFSLRWYGVLFASGFLIAFKVMEKMMIREKRSPEPIGDLLLFLMVGTVVGARLGHCLFYESEVYLKEPLRILYVWEGGLASHGGTVGCLIATAIFLKKHKEFKPLWLLDRLCIPIAITAAMIRLGNFFNSEILGKPTQGGWGVVFMRQDPIARHPAQLYESIIYATTFFAMTYAARNTQMFRKPGRSFGIFLCAIYGSRIFVEMIKENQVDFEQGMALNMGQWLSFPFVLAGLILIFRKVNQKA